MLRLSRSIAVDAFLLIKMPEIDFADERGTVFCAKVTDPSFSAQITKVWMQKESKAMIKSLIGIKIRKSLRQCNSTTLDTLV